MPFLTTAQRWRATFQRDASARGYFVYAVKTTKIYCRPDCPSRLARRANVDFFDNPSDAIQAGYRACKRCSPDTTLDGSKVGHSASDASAIVVERVCDIFKNDVKEQQDSGGLRKLNNASRPPPNLTMSDVAAKLGLTRSHLHRVFKARVGITPKEYLQRLKSNTTQSEEQLEFFTDTNNAFLTDTAIDVGQAEYIMSPARFREWLQVEFSSLDTASSQVSTSIHSPSTDSRSESEDDSTIWPKMDQDELLFQDLFDLLVDVPT